MARAVLMATLVALIHTAAPLTAQFPPSIKIGDRLRITDASGNVVTGTLLAGVGKGVVVLRSAGYGTQIDTIWMNEVRRIEVPGVSKHSGLWYTSVTTGTSAAALGLLFVLAEQGDLLSGCHGDTCEIGEVFGFGAVLGGMIGLPLGLLVAAWNGQTWQDVTPDLPITNGGSLQLGIPAKGGVALKASIPIGTR